MDVDHQGRNIRRFGWGLALLIAFLFIAPVCAKWAGLLKPRRTEPWTVRMPKAIEPLETPALE